MSQDQGKPSVLSMEVDVENEDESEYRILFGKHVRYLGIAPDTFEQDVLSFPIDSLPPLPLSDPDWKVAYISPAVQNVWHPTRIDVLDLDKVVQLTAAAFEAVLPTSALLRSASASHGPSQDVRVIAKIARFEWEIPRIERETRAYQILEQQQVAPKLVPRFIGHLHEHGRVMGFIIEKLEHRQHASVDHLKACEMALGEFHKFGLHGDVNRHNFLVGQDGEVTLLDFERFEEGATADSKAKEMQTLEAELMDELGRGGGFRSGDFVD